MSASTEETGPESQAPAAVPADGASLGRFRAALVVSVISQFLPYSPGSEGAILTHELDQNYWTGMARWGHDAQSGWRLHAFIALLGLPLLIWVFFTRARLRPFWTRYGHWVALAILVICGMGDFGTFGPWLGVVSIGLAIWAVAARRRELATAPPAPPAG
jgi:hypothetical protein